MALSLRGRNHVRKPLLPQRTPEGWVLAFALWTATMAVALIAAEVLIFLSYSPSVFTPTRTELAVVVFFASLLIWLAGMALASVLAAVVYWAIDRIDRARSAR
jgi:hypothetical protein